MIFVTGGAGFIGSNFVLEWLRNSAEAVVNLDKLTYSGNLENLRSLEGDDRHVFVRGCVTDEPLIETLLARHRPRAIVHLAAESHVDRSIHGPEEFIRTNVLGTFHLLEALRRHRDRLPAAEADELRFLHVSTDEVYGSLEPNEPPFSELRRYEPNSPYSASKAGSDHLVRAYRQTYGLPTLLTNCSNNYGPFQFPEKLIPLVIVNALAGKPLPVYGDGRQVRDWLFVLDHCSALRRVLDTGVPGQTYNVGGRNELTNLDVVTRLCTLLDELKPAADGRSYQDQIAFVADRPGHDRRYAIDSRKIATDLNWTPAETFEGGIRRTVEWYLGHADWIAGVTSGAYRGWIDRHYGEAGSNRTSIAHGSQ